MRNESSPAISIRSAVSQSTRAISLFSKRDSSIQLYRVRLVLLAAPCVVSICSNGVWSVPWSFSPFLRVRPCWRNPPRLPSNGAGYVNGEVVTMDGGEWLGAGEFTALGRELTAKEWEMMKPKPKKTKE